MKFFRSLSMRCLFGSIWTLAWILTGSLSLADTVVVVHPDNPIEQLSDRQVKKIFLGKIRLYPGTQIEIIPLDQSESTESSQQFYQRFIKMSPAKLHSYRASYLFSGKGRIPESLGKAERVKESVAENTAAIGYLDQGLVDDSVKVVFVVPD